jgi:hypothetical protein
MSITRSSAARANLNLGVHPIIRGPFFVFVTENSYLDAVVGPNNCYNE